MRRFARIVIVMIVVGIFVFGCFISKYMQRKEFFGSLNRIDANGIAKYLRSGVDPNVCTPIPMSGKFWIDLKSIVAGSGKQDSDTRCMTTEPAIFIAIQNGDYASVKELVGAGANVNKQSFDGTTPSMVAVTQIVYSYEEQPDLLERRSLILNYLLDHGADVNKKNDKGADLLIVAGGQGTLTDLILDHGARPLPGDKNWAGDVLIYAAGNQNVDRIAKLISRGANINYQFYDGSTALMNTSSIEVIRFLIKHGADLKIRDKKGSTALDHMRYLVCTEGYEIIKAELDKTSK